MSSKAVLTLALDKPIYLQMAATLVRSFCLWNSDSEIQCYVVTDKAWRIPRDVKDSVEVISVESDQFGKGFSPKLHLDRLAPADQTLFIDADCLITGPLDSVFDRFEGCSVSTVGRMISEGEWWGDVAERCEKVGVDEVPLLVGCVYYLEDDSTAKDVYETARSLEGRYDELGLIPLRGSPNEEPLVSLGMALHGQEPIPDNGRIKADAMSYPSGIEVDVFEGTSLFKDYTNQENITGRLRDAYPVIAHFNDTYAEEPPYIHEAAKLQKVQAEGWPVWLAEMYATCCRTIPYRTVETAKDVLRPLYRLLFGTRSVKENPRIPK
jgi:hypothetical protein